MAGRLRPLRIVPWIVAGGMWAAALIAAPESPRCLSMPWDRLIDCATVCATVWAIVAAYTGRLREHDAMAARLVNLLADATREGPPSETQFRRAKLGSLRASR